MELAHGSFKAIIQDWIPLISNYGLEFNNAYIDHTKIGKKFVFSFFFLFLRSFQVFFNKENILELGTF